MTDRDRRIMYLIMSFIDFNLSDSPHYYREFLRENMIYLKHNYGLLTTGGHKLAEEVRRLLILTGLSIDDMISLLEKLQEVYKQ